MLLKKKNECLNNIDFWFFYSLKINYIDLLIHIIIILGIIIIKYII